MSKTAQAYNIYSKRKNFFGIQATVEGEFNKNKYQAFFGSDYSPGMFSWIVPESDNVARVGLVAKKEAKHFFDLLIKQHGFKIKEMQAGMIPLFNQKQKLKSDNCYLLGDAAGFVKATSFGGIIPGMKQAQILADCINFRKDYFNETKKLRQRLSLHLKVRKVMDKLTVDEWDRLVMIAKGKSVRRVLESHTRENLFPIVLKTILKEPRLVFLARYLL
jgi:digeranylgeranylglycerophospholipid reductase